MLILLISRVKMQALSFENVRLLVNQFCGLRNKILFLFNLSDGVNCMASFALQ